MSNCKSKLNEATPLTQNPSVKKPLYLGMAQQWERKPVNRANLWSFYPLNPQQAEQFSREGEKEEKVQRGRERGEKK